MAVLKLQEMNNIEPTWAGCDALYSVQQLDRILEIIDNAGLVEKNGFLVLP